MIRKVLSDSFIYGMSPHIPKIASLFIYPLITANVTEYDYGIMAIIFAYQGLFSVLSGLGMNLLIVNSFFKNPTRYIWRWRYIYGILKTWNIIFNSLISILIFFVLPKELGDTRFLIITLLFLPIVILGPVNTFAKTYYQLKKMPFQVAWRTILSGVLTIILNYYTIVELQLGFLGWIWSTAIVTLIIGFTNVYVKHFVIKLKPIYALKYNIIKSYLRITVPTIPHYYSGYLLNSSDRIVMDVQNISINNMGNYGFAYSFGNYFNFLGQAFSTALTPFQLELLKAEKHEKFRDLIFFIILLFFSISFSVSIFCKEIFEFLVKNEQLKSLYPLSIIIIMSYCYRPIYMGVMSRYFYNEKTKKIWRISFIAGLINLLANLILIPIYGFEIAAYTTFVAFIYMGYSGYFIKMYKEVKTEFQFHPIFWMVTQISLTFLAYYYRDASLMFKISLVLLVWQPFVFWYIKKKHNLNK